MSRQPLLQPGEIVHHYHLRRLLGSGCEGDTFLAVDARDDALRTVKIFRGRNMVADARHTARYFRRLASCPSVKAIREWGVLLDQPSVSERPWLAFEYIKGKRLADHILSGRVKHPLRVLLAVCDALAPIHRIGFAIGDFDHDRNLLLEKGTGLIKFCDLDAGGPTEPPPGLDDDMRELIRMSRRMWSRSDSKAKAVIAALESSQNAVHAGANLRDLQAAKAWPP